MIQFFNKQNDLVIFQLINLAFFFQFVSIISITFVVLSTAGMTANTIPSVAIMDE